MIDVEAFQIFARLDMHSTWERQESAEDLQYRADAFVDLMHDAPDGWGLEWLRTQLRYGTVPKLIDIVEAWRKEKTEFLIAAAKQMPDPPEAILDDDTASIMWERAYRTALLDGADHASAYAAANRTVGLSADLPAPSRTVIQPNAQLRAAIAQAAQSRAVTLEENLS